ncbi:MAG: DUF3857 and transglutaminase domain-containing protein [Candidatus Omnitrophica bacterium]|nr:DUF3857 and transglutaminase domain-containing protein [Candidatus Omnitrophota bacterium]
MGKNIYIAFKLIFFTGAFLFFILSGIRAELEPSKTQNTGSPQIETESKQIKNTQSSQIEDKETLEIIKNSATAGDKNTFVRSVMLLFDEKYTLKNATSGILKRHVLIKVTREGGRKAGTITIPYNEYFEEAKLNIARTIQPDGKIQDVSGEAIKDESPYSDYPIYSDLKIKKVTFPNVQVGSIIEYEVEFVKKDNIFPGASCLFTVPGNWTLNLVRFSVDVPQGVPFKFKAERFFNNEPVISGSANGKTYTWQMDHTWVKGSDEMAVPNYMRISPYVIFSTIEDWQKVNDWAINLMKDQSLADAQIESKVKELLGEEQKDRREIIKRLYYYVSQNIRYVAIELGELGFKPYPAPQVLKNSYGDCKGKSVLLIAMLKAAGIDAYPALVMTSNAGFILPEIPDLSFNHMIVAIPEGENYLFLDPTADMLTLGKLPYPDQGCEAFILAKEKKAGFVTLPKDSPEDNKELTKAKIILNRDSSGEVEIDSTLTGMGDWLGRNLAKSTPPGRQKKIVEQIGRTGTSNFSLKEFSFSDYKDMEKPFNMKMAYTADNFCQKNGDLLFLKVPLDVPLSPMLFAKVPREAPLYLGYPCIKEHIITITIPPGYEIRNIQKDLDLENLIAAYNKKIEVKGKRIEIYNRWVLKTDEVSAGKSGALGSMINKIANSNKEDIILEQTK